jgi:tocopherol cyclase
MRRYLYNTFHPEIYHGYGKKPPFFEGWYYKLVDATEQHRYAIIPGIFRAEDPSKNHSFIQVLNGMTGEATYHTFPEDAFDAHPEQFRVRVGNNYFQADSLSLDIQDEALSLKGQLHFQNLAPFPITLLSPGIMGWYGWIPFMECYHGVVSLDHVIRGSLTINRQEICFDHGRGYIEKDWGQNFPAGYVWQQSNHFRTPGTSLTASIAMIPFINTVFPGFIIALWHHASLFRFATYTGAVTERLEITDDCVFWVVRDQKYRLEMVSQRASGGLLHAPIRTEMHKRVDETMRSAVQVKLSRLDGTVLFEEEGRCAALEVNGDLSGLVTR